MLLGPLRSCQGACNPAKATIILPLLHLIGTCSASGCDNLVHTDIFGRGEIDSSPKKTFDTIKSTFETLSERPVFKVNSLLHWMCPHPYPSFFAAQQGQGSSQEWKGYSSTTQTPSPKTYIARFRWVSAALKSSRDWWGHLPTWRVTACHTLIDGGVVGFQ